MTIGVRRLTRAALALARVAFVTLAVTGAALAQTPTTFEIYPAPNGLGTGAAEPSIGANWNSDRVMFIAGLQTLRVDYEQCFSPPEDTWTDVSALNTSITSLDPILFTDSVTGRTFVSQLAAKCSNMAYTDDDGDTWMLSQGCGINSGVDHQTVGGGPYNVGATPPPPAPSPPDFYPHAVYYCSQDAVTAQCARSDNGGLTFGPAVPTWTIADCGGLHGAIHVDTDGTVYVPNKNCATPARNTVAVSEDNGLTWSLRPLPNSAPSNGAGRWDPSVWAATSPGSGANGTGVGTLYMCFINGNNQPWAAVSKNQGATWTNIQRLGLGAGPGGLNVNSTAFPVAAAGDGDRAACGFLGSTLGGGGGGTNAASAHVWYPYVAVTYDGGVTWTTKNISPADPAQRGDICSSGTTCGASRNLLDFNDMAVDREGRIHFGFADGCLGSCVSSPPNSGAELATIARQVSGRRLFAAFDVAGPPDPPRLQADVDPDVSTLIHLSWKAPDDHGSAITGYDVYRRLQGEISPSFLASYGPNVFTHDDVLASPTDKAFYSVLASNGFGESGLCREVQPKPPENPCVPPGVTVLQDGTEDWTAPDPATQIPEYDLERLSINERQDLGAGKIEFVLKVVSMSSPPPLNSTWPVTFTSAGGSFFVRMHTTAIPGEVLFTYGTGTATAPATAPGSPADPASGFSADGSIRIVVNRSNIGNPAIGSNLTGFLVRLRREAGAVALTPDNMPDSLTPSGSYTVFGSELCSIGDNPIAVDDVAETDQDTPVVIDVVANDTSFNGALSVVAVDTPTNGSVANNGNGTVTYSPDPGFFGADRFGYTIRDAAGLEASATVFVTVHEKLVGPPHCERPGVLVVADPLGDTNAVIDATDDPSLDIEAVYMAEPDFGPGEQKLVVTLKVEDFALPHPSAAWRVFWTSPGGTQQYFVSLESCDATAGLQCSYGTFDGTLFSSQGDPEGCDFDADGTITITVAKSLVGIDDTSHEGLNLTNVNGRTQVFIGALCTGLLGQADNAGPASYEIQTNESCRNRDPIADDDFESTDEDTPVLIDVLANDSDPDNDPIEVINTGQGSNGSVANNGGASVTYTPDIGFVGSDSFTYTISDGKGGTAGATVTVQVNEAVEHRPVAADDAYEIDEDMTLVALAANGVLANDTDADGDLLSANGPLSGPSNGALTLNPDGSFNYTPNADFNGTDSFTYEACDPVPLCDAATVTITVRPVNDHPFAADDAYSTPQDTTLNVAAPGVLANDADADGDALTASGPSSGPANGSATVNADGSFSYTPDTGFTGTDSFTYTVCDDGDPQLCDSATVTINVTGGQNVAPVADDQSVSTPEDTAVAVTLTASDGNGDALTYTVVAAPSNGSLSGAAPNLTYTPNPDYNGPDSFTFKANDGLEDSNVATVSITVEPINDAPQANDDAATTDKDTAITLAVLANDNDVDGDALTVGAGTDATSAQGGTVTNNGSNLTYTPPAGFTGTDTFTYQACDPSGACDTATVTVTVNDEPQPPTEGLKVTGGGWLESLQGKKINFGFNAKQKPEGPRGNLQLNDKGMAKIHLSTVTSIGGVTGECGSVGSGANAVEFRGVGSYNGAAAEFRVCVEDNGEPGNSGPSANPDKFHLECLSGCAYSTAARTPDARIDGGNIQVHKATSSSTGGGEAPLAAAGPVSLADPKVLILQPILLDSVAVDVSQLVAAYAYDAAGDPLHGVPVTLTWFGTAGTSGRLTTVTDAAGAAIFSIGIGPGETEFLAGTGPLKSNAVNIRGVSAP